jgi:AraC-like DNA-binding protein
MFERKILTDTGIGDICLIGKYRYDKAGKCLEPHCHADMMEIVYCHRGTQVYETQNQTFRIKGGDIFITFPDEMHSTNKKPEEKGIIYWMLICINPTGKRLLQLPDDESDLLAGKLLSIGQRHFKADPMVHRLFEEMFSVNELYIGAEKKIRMKQLVLQLLILLVDMPARHHSGIHDSKAAVVQLHIHDNLAKPLTIEYLAGVVHLSESRFKSWFKQHFGMPAMEYVQRQRITRAIEMWSLDPGMKISDIAYSLNLSSPQHFSKLFKKYTGITPLHFKRSKENESLSSSPA